MMTDDQRYDTFGFMSDNAVITPNLDQMAKEGVRFNNAYHVSPICMPSRASVHMGKYMTDHRCGFDRPTDSTISRSEFASSYPVKLRENGYYTGFIGKFGYAVTQEKIKNANKVKGQRLYKDAYKRRNSEEDKETSMPKDCFDVWYGFTGQGNYYPEGNGFNGYENPYGAKHLNDFMGHQAESFIEEASALGKPFNLSISFKAPHGPWTPEEQYLKLYDEKTVPRQYNDTSYHFNLLPEVVRTQSRNPDYYLCTGEWKNWGAGSWEEETNYQEDLKKYYALITGVDAVVGRIRKVLKALDLERDTILVYTSDNGLFCGSKMIHGKAILYEESIKAPMIIVDPSISDERKGMAIDGLISHVDIAPTLLDMANISRTDCSYRGKSFLPMIKGDIDSIHEYVYGENNYNDLRGEKSESKNPDKYQSIRSKYVRGKDYKLIRYHECEPIIEEMFDVINDPYEENNLAGDQGYLDIYKRLQMKLDDFETVNA